MLKPTKKQISIAISGTVLIGMAALIAYAAVIFAPSKQPIGFIAQPTLSNFNVTSGNERVYRGMYDNSDWSGRFECFPVAANGYVNLASPCFISGASSPLDVQAAANTRNIGTRSDATSAAGIEFSTTGLTTTQQTTIGGAANVNFIRGTSLTPTGLRARKTVLGDIIHSRPYFYTDGTNPTVFVGANDGMLHAFDASTGNTAGQERWAYVPSMLIPRLSALSATSYAHDYFVDGGISIAKIASGSKTILVGALGAGGKGLYALDITTLTAANGTAAGGKGLWEITPTTVTAATRATSTSYANLGDTYSAPVIVPTQDSKDSVIVGNGYNNLGDGCAYLYVIDASNGALTQAVKAGTCSTTSPNGLSSPLVIDKNGDGKADRVYAGDINGNMWVFDLSSSTPASWSATLLYATGQAITQAPTVAVHPYGGYMVNFATGRILSGPAAATIAPSTAAAADDTADATTSYAAYGLWDDLSTGTALTITTSELITQSITTSTYNPTATSPAASSVSVRSMTTDNKPDWTVNRGWKAVLPIAGERVTGDGAFIDNNKFVFNVTNPTVGYTPNGSSVASKGVNWLFELDFLTGGAGNGPFLDMDRSGIVNDADRIKLTSGSPNLAASGIPVAYITSNGVQSQPILVQLRGVRVPLYNQNYNGGSVAPTNGTGVNGGHFDVDISYWTGGTWGQGGGGPGINTNTHNHEYDKMFDTNGLNFLNPNDTTLALSNAVPSATTPYKVLVFNQGWNRAVNLRISTNTWNTRQYMSGPNCTTALPCAPYVKYTSTTIPTGAGVGYLDVANLPQYTGVTSTVGPTLGVDYTVAPNAPGNVAGKITVINVTTTGSISCGGLTSAGTPVVTGSGCTTTTAKTGNRNAIGGLEFSMPNDGFNIQDWWGDGVLQTGVVPTSPQCPDGVDPNAATPAFVANAGKQKQVTGPQGERNAGVITVQIIAANTPNSAVQMNVAGKPEFGFRVTDASAATYLLAEYTLYWHHPLSVCMGDTSTAWTTTNNQKDSWWPTQTNGGAPVLTGYTTLGDLKCFNGQKSGTGTVTWKTTAPGNWATPLGVPGTGNVPWPPKGFTMQPPMDSALTLPPCPTYDVTKDDPRSASFIDKLSGAPGTSGVPPSATLSSGMGGSLAGADATTGAGGTTPGSGVPGSGVPPAPPPQTGGLPVARRITWRELIGL